MGDGLGEKIEGKADELGGNVKQGFGKVTGNEEMQSEGATQEAVGKGEGVVGGVKDAAGKVGDTLKGIGNTIGDKLGGNKDENKA